MAQSNPLVEMDALEAWFTISGVLLGSAVRLTVE